MVATTASAGEADNAELAKQLANPISALISVPLQLNLDRNLGAAGSGERWTLNVQPVVPITVNDDWNLISRTIVPLVHQDDVFPGAGSDSGVGDVVQSLFLSPREPFRGWIVGAGPVFLVPTGTDSALTADKWGAGPTAVALKQSGGWTYGMLANHIWSFAGDADRTDVSATFLQPFLSYTTPAGLTFTLQTESTYDWEREQWTVPVAGLVSRVMALGSQRISIAGGLRYYADSAPGGPDGWGFRAVLTFLFPR
jgi:hypothetical protein